jgi:hypothetical protein
MRPPRGDFPPQKRRTASALTRATISEPARSVSSKVRPSLRGMPMASMYPDEANRYSMAGSCALSKAWPSMEKFPLDWLPLRGRSLIAPA